MASAVSPPHIAFDFTPNRVASQAPAGRWSPPFLRWRHDWLALLPISGL